LALIDIDGEVVFEQGDATEMAMYLVTEGQVELSQGALGRDMNGNARPAIVLARVDPASERPWFGELQLFVRLPRHSTATVLQPARLLRLSPNHFEEFLELLPDFRTFLNRSTRSSAAHAISNREMTLEQSRADEARNRMQSTVSVVWQSGARLGTNAVLGASGAAERSAFAERWERIVTAMLARAGDSDYTKAMATVSFKTTDYIPHGQRSSRDVASA